MDDLLLLDQRNICRGDIDLRPQKSTRLIGNKVKDPCRGCINKFSQCGRYRNIEQIVVTITCHFFQMLNDGFHSPDPHDVIERQSKVMVATPILQHIVDSIKLKIEMIIFVERRSCSKNNDRLISYSCLIDLR